jgi:hypothetical protein
MDDRQAAPLSYGTPIWCPNFGLFLRGGRLVVVWERSFSKSTYDIIPRLLPRGTRL